MLKPEEKWNEIFLSNRAIQEIFSDDIIGGSTKTAQHSIKNYSRNIKAVFFELGTSNVHHKRNVMTLVVPLP